MPALLGNPGHNWRFPDMRKQINWVPVAFLLSATMWIWIQSIAIPHQQSDSAARGVPRGNLSDLYPRWLGARELLLHHRDPYRDEITREIQIGYYGRELDASHPNDPKDQQAFAYPVYVVVMLAPTVRLPFSTVRTFFFWILTLFTALSVVLWLQALQWYTSSASKILWITLTLGCFPAIQGLKLQQLTVLIAALIAASFYAISRHRFALSGILLSFATIKPQLVVLLLLWLAIWVAGDWRARRRLLLSFAGSMAMLVGFGEILLPGWIGEFRGAMTAYYLYTGGGKSVLDVVLTPTWGRIVSGLLVVVLLFLCSKLRKGNERSSDFQYSLALTLATTLLVIPMFAPYNQLLLLPSAMVLCRSISQLWKQSRLSRFLLSVTAFSVLWPFAAGSALVLALAFLPAATVQKAWELPIYTNFAIPIMIYATLLASQRVLSFGTGNHESYEQRILPQGASGE